MPQHEWGVREQLPGVTSPLQLVWGKWPALSGPASSRQFCFCCLSCCRGDEIIDVSPDNQCFYVGSRHRSDSGLSVWCPLSRLPSLSGFWGMVSLCSHLASNSQFSCLGLLNAGSLCATMPHSLSTSLRRQNIRNEDQVHLSLPCLVPKDKNAHAFIPRQMFGYFVFLIVAWCERH